MNTSSLWSRGRLQELDAQECKDLLAVGSVGRVAFETAEGLMVLPVNYTVTDDRLLFRTAPHGVIASHVAGRRAAFEVDDIDDFTQSAWSVLVRGTANFVESVDEVPTDLRPEPWAEGIRSLFVAIDLTTVTGRRLLSS